MISGQPPNQMTAQREDAFHLIAFDHFLKSFHFHLQGKANLLLLVDLGQELVESFFLRFPRLFHDLPQLAHLTLKLSVLFTCGVAAL